MKGVHGFCNGFQRFLESAQGFLRKYAWLGKDHWPVERGRDGSEKKVLRLTKDVRALGTSSMTYSGKPRGLEAFFWKGYVQETFRSSCAKTTFERILPKAKQGSCENTLLLKFLLGGLLVSKRSSGNASSGKLPLVTMSGPTQAKSEDG